MEDITILKLHALFLFNISDHIIRSIPCKFGIILGTRDTTSIEISNSFEILMDDSLNMDFEYLLKKLEQFKTIIPHLSLMGIYQISDDLNPNKNTFFVAEQLRTFKEQYNWERDTQIMCLMSYPNNLNVGDIDSTSKSFQGYIYPRNTKIATSIFASQTEIIASKTISKHSKYSSTEKNSACKSFDLLLNEELSTSVNSLYNKVKDIIDYLESDKMKELTSINQIEVENQISYLANKISSYASGNTTMLNLYNHKLQTTQLALLEDQLTALSNLNNELFKITSKQNISNSTF